METKEDKVWKERSELQIFRDVERKVAYQLRQEGHIQPIIWEQK